MLSAKKELFTPSGGGYQISRSVRFRSSSSAYFTRTPSVAGNRRTFTISAWVKKGRVDDVAAGVQASSLFGAGNTGNVSGFKFAMGDIVQGTNTQIFSSQETIHNVSNQFIWYGTEKYRDPSAWYHVVVAFDTPQATANNRLKIWVNGQQIGTGNYTVSLAQNQDLSWNNNVPQFIGASTTNVAPWLTFFDGLLAEVYSVDGQALTPSSFGETNAITGVWQPKKYTGTYGTNGFYLNFSDNSAATATTIGKDYSGNGNNFTPSAGISVTAGVTYDSMLDVPTPYDDGDKGRGNYAVMNPLDNQSNLSNANLYTQEPSAGTYGNSRATIAIPTSGKWYWEHTIANAPSSGRITVGLATEAAPLAAALVGAATTVSYDTRYGINRAINNQTTLVRNDAAIAFTTNDIVQCAYDAATGKLWFGKNNAWFDTATGTTGNPSAGTNQIMTVTLTGPLFPFISSYNETTGAATYVNFGQQPFTYTPPTGFKALNTQNLPDSTIKKGNVYFDATTYTGTGSSLAVVNSGGFQPDLVWTKSRSNTYSNHLEDAVRGVGQRLLSDSTAAEVTGVNGKLTSFNSNGFTQDGGVEVGASAATYVAWQWDAGTTTVTNTSGSISAQVRANPTAGCSVVTYTGTGANATVGHGLGVAPSFIIARRRDNSVNWYCYHTSLSAGNIILLNSTNAQASVPTAFNSGTPTSTTFPVGGDSTTNASGGLQLAYCFAAVAGYSAFGRYTGNGAADGPFVFTGFRPKFIIVKRTDVANAWVMFDTTRSTYNQSFNYLLAENSQQEITTSGSTDTLDFLSNGFKLRCTTLAENANNGSYIYMAFAENPFKNSLAR